MIRLPSLQPTQINNPQMDARAAAAPAVALGHVASAIAGVDEYFHQTAVNAQKQENARKVSEMMMGLDGEYANLQLELQKDTDPASQITRTRDFFAQAKGKFDSEELPPAVREQLRGHYDKFAHEAMIQQGANSARLQQKRTELQLSNQVSSAIQSGNGGAAQQAIEMGVAAGVMLPEEAEAKMKEVNYHLDFRKQQAAIAADPLAAEKALSAPDYLQKNPLMTPEAQHSLQSQAEQQANRYRSDFANDLIISGTMPTADELKTMEELGQIDKAQHARWASKIRESSVPLSDPALYEESYTQIMAYDPKADPSGRGEAQLRNWIGSQTLPPEDIKQLNSKLTERVKLSTDKKPKSVHESGFAAKIATDFTRGDWGKYRFPVDHDNDPSTAPITPINKTEYDKAWKLRGQFAEQWRGILEGMPEDASFEQVSGAYDALKTQFKDKKPMPDLSFSKPISMPFDPDTLYAASGKTFGGQPIKPAGAVYSGAAATVFGGPNDPVDNGKSALGGTTGKGGREGTAIPQKLLQTQFPGKDKAWIDQNVRTVVRGPDGALHTLAVADFGTAEWVWQKNGRPTLDLTEGAAKQLGGQVIYTPNGKLQAVKGLDKISFAVVSTATAAPIKGMSWDDAKTSWFKVNRPTSNEQAMTSLVALRDRWNRENMDDDEASPPASGEEQSPQNTGEFSQYNVIPE